MQCLIDGDVLRYELGFCGEYKGIDEETGEETLLIREWDFVEGLIRGRIEGILKDCESEEPPIIFLTANLHAIRLLNRRARYQGGHDTALRPQFRELVATSRPYKGTRKEAKPFHFDNITAFFIANYDCRIANGLEADDYMALEQCSRPEGSTIICSRDKDLRMVPGYHFGWECGAQPSFGPELVDRRGRLWLNKRGEVKGTGLKFFFYQMLVGDSVDNIPGCKGVGPKTAYPLLVDAKNKAECEQIILEQYTKAYGEDAHAKLEEMSKLLWMVQQLKEDGTPVHYDWKLN